MTPTDVLWRIIGDVFSVKVFRGNGRRLVEALWQGLSDMSADSIEYAEWIRKAQSPITAQPWAPWGTFGVSPALDTSSFGSRGNLLGYCPGATYSWGIWSTEEPIPAGSLITLGDSISYAGVGVRPLSSGGSIYTLEGASSLKSAIVAQGLDDSSRLSFLFCGEESSRFLDASDVEISKSSRGWRVMDRPFSFKGVGDTVETGADWQMTWVFDNAKWSDVTPAKRVLGVYSFGATSSFDLVLTDDAGTLVTSPAMPGDHAAAYAALQAGGQIEFTLDYNGDTQVMTAGIWIGDVNLGEVSASIPPEPRTHTVGGLNERGDCEVYLVAIVSRRGEPRFSSLDTSAQTSVSGGVLFRVDAPIVSAASISSCPWPLRPEFSDVVIEFDTVSGFVGEDWLHWAPEYARLDADGGWYSLKKSPDDGKGHVSYDIVARHGNPSNALQDSVISPWFTTDVSFRSPGIMIAPIDTPPRVWLEDTRAVELDMHARWGEKLGFDVRADSEEFMSAIQGSWMSRSRPPTRANLTDSIGVFLGVPFSVRGGFVRSVVERLDSIEILVGNVPHRVDKKWGDLLVKPGAFVQPYGLLATGIVVDDYKSNPDKIISTFGVWEQWKSFLVRIPSTVGASASYVSELTKMIDISKKKTYQFLIEFDAPTYASALEESFNTPIGHTTATSNVDSVFGDAYAVSLAPGDPDASDIDSVRADLAPYNFSMPENRRGIPGRRIRARWSRNPRGGYTHRDRGVDLARPLGSREDDFGRNDLRFSPLNIEPYRPSDMCAVREVSSGHLAKNVVLVLTQGDEAGDLKASLDTFADSTVDRVGVLLMSTTDCGTTTEALAVGANDAATLKASWAALGNSSSTVNTGEAMVAALDMLTPGSDALEYARQKVVILVVDQDTTCPVDPIAAAEGLRQTGAIVHVMAARATPTAQMNAISSATAVGASGALLAASLDSALASENSFLAPPRRFSFEQVTNPTTDLYGAWVESAKNAQVVGGVDGFWRTTDYGETWTPDPTGSTQSLTATYKNWVVGEFEEVYTHDGASWSNVSVTSSGGPWDMFGVHTNNDGGVVVWGNYAGDGALFYSIDGSLPFTQYDVSGDEVSGAYWVNGRIIFGSSGGDLFSHTPGEASSNLLGKGQFLALDESSDTIVAAQSSGDVTILSGARIEEVATGLLFDSIHWIRGSEFMAIVNSNDIYQSLDHGRSWTQIDTFVPTPRFIAGSRKRRIMIAGEEVWAWK